ncbi:MAG: hypothetical protein M3O25_07340, partial [Actinomycetota bacterium]|nr:hypothetical protein [Actinomycetota bacterium]
MRVLAVTGVFAGIAYVFTPLTASGGLGQPTGFEANLRYVSPALIIGLTITPLVPALRRRPWPWALIALFALFVAQGTLRVGLTGGFDIDASPSWNYGHLDESLELALLVVGVPALIVAGARVGIKRWALAGFGVAALALTLVLGNTQRDQYLDERYEASVAPVLEAGFRSTPDWTPLQVFGKRTSDSRIGVVGRASAFGQYFFYGDDLSNHVQYLGKELDRGTFRQIDNCRDLRRIANDGDYDYLVVTPRIRRETSVPPELFWVGDDPAAKKNVSSSGLAGVFRVDGRLDPSTCDAAETRYRAAKAEQEEARRIQAEALLEALPPDEEREARQALKEEREGVDE